MMQLSLPGLPPLAAPRPRTQAPTRTGTRKAKRETHATIPGAETAPPELQRERATWGYRRLMGAMLLDALYNAQDGDQTAQAWLQIDGRLYLEALGMELPDEWFISWLESGCNPPLTAPDDPDEGYRNITPAAAGFLWGEEVRISEFAG